MVGDQFLRLVRRRTRRRRRRRRDRDGRARARARRRSPLRTRSRSPARATPRRAAARPCSSTCSRASPAPSLFIRFSTWGIRDGWWPAGNVKVRGRHVHHFVPGIALAFLSGGAGLVTSDETPRGAARVSLRRRDRPHTRRGGAPAAARGRLLDPRGPAQRPDQLRRSRPARRGDPRPADAAPRRAALRARRAHPGYVGRVRGGDAGVRSSARGAGGCRWRSRCSRLRPTLRPSSTRAPCAPRSPRTRGTSRSPTPKAAGPSEYGTERAAGGTLGFRTAAGWQHATTRDLRGAHEGRVTRSDLATTDPTRTIDRAADRVWRGCDRPGGATSTARSRRPRRSGSGLRSRPAERYFGFGERSNAVDQAGPTVENYVSDGPYQAEEYPLINLVAPPWGLRDGHTDATYYPVPWLLSSAGYGVLVDNPETSYFRLGATGPGCLERRGHAAPRTARPARRWSPEVDRLPLRFFAGPKPADALRAVHRRPQATSRSRRRRGCSGPGIRPTTTRPPRSRACSAADAPVSALQTYTHYLPCGDQVGQGEAERAAGRDRPRRRRSQSPPTSTR